MRKENLPPLRLPPALMRLLQLGAAAGLAVFILGIVLVPERSWSNFLIVEYYLLGLGLGAGFFVASQYVSNSGWGVGIRRVPEAIASTLPVAGIGALVLLLGVDVLYEWSHQEAVLQDPVLIQKRAWLNPTFFAVRLVFYFLVWIFLSRMIVSNSLAQDHSGDVSLTRRNVRNSVFLLIAGVYTFSLATIDLLMSLQPHWYSTIFAWLNLSGIFLSALAGITVVVVILRSLGYGNLFTVDHLHNLGRLMMGFSLFWVYMWVSQHMLIWYSNIPEETSYYHFRHFGGWGSLSFLNLVLNWLIPFAVLLPRATKRSDKIMLQMAGVILVGRWLDLYIIVMPTTFGAEPLFGIWEIGPALGMISVFLWMVLRILQSRNLVPLKDPYLMESLPQLARTGTDLENSSRA